jgi:tRNA-binding protein
MHARAFLFINTEINSMATYDDFAKLDIRVGKIVAVEDFPQAIKPAYKLTIDFGSEIGIKKSSAQVKKYYSQETLMGKIVLGVVNFPPKQIGPFISECLTLGVPDEDDQCVLISPSNDKAVLGGKLF